MTTDIEHNYLTIPEVVIHTYVYIIYVLIRPTVVNISDPRGGGA